MDPTVSWEPRAALLEAAKLAGFKLSEPQLGRLHRAGIVARPRVRMLGRGKGTVSEFPPGSTNRLLRVLAFHREERSLSVVAWRVWWEDGGALPPLVSRRLAGVADAGDRLREQCAELLRLEEAGDEEAARRLEEIDREMESARLPRVLGAVRRTTGQARFPTLARMLLEVMAGRFDGYGTEIEDPALEGKTERSEKAALLERALGRPSSNRLASLDETRFHTSEEVFVHITKIFSERTFASYLAVEDHVVDRARAEIRGFLTLATTMGPLVRRLIGGTGLGSTVALKALDVREPDEQALTVLGWLVLRRDTELTESMKELIALLPKAMATIRLEQIRTALAKEVPELSELLSDRSHGRALREAGYAKRRIAHIATVADEHRERVDAFTRAHPEIDELVAIIEGRDD